MNHFLAYELHMHAKPQSSHLARAGRASAGCPGSEQLARLRALESCQARAAKRLSSEHTETARKRARN